MTDLRRPIRRRSRDPFAHYRRRIVVSLEPGDVLAMRLERSRTTYRATLAVVFRTLADWHARAEVRRRQEERQARRGQPPEVAPAPWLRANSAGWQNSRRRGSGNQEKAQTMSLNRRTSFLQSRRELSDADLLRLAPSVFAGQAMPGVSDRYAFLPTARVVARMRDAGWVPVEATEQRVRLEGRLGFQKHLLRFQRRDLIAVKGEYAAEICLVNSHDRSSAYQLHAGLFRFICGNGLLVADSTFERVSLRHSGFEPEQVIDASFAVLDQLPRITASVEGFRARRLTPAESRAFAESALLLRYDDAQAAPIAPEKLLQARRFEDGGDDLWNVFNKVGENLLRGGLKDWSRRKADGTRFPRTRAVTGLDENVRLNKALWHLAEALKTGAVAN